MLFAKIIVAFLTVLWVPCQASEHVQASLVRYESMAISRFDVADSEIDPMKSRLAGWIQRVQVSQVSCGSNPVQQTSSAESDRVRFARRANITSMSN